jgi:exonuclease VII small subunit
LKEKIIRGEEVNMDEFDEIVNRLENQTGELSSIVGFEKRKLEKYLATN